MDSQTIPVRIGRERRMLQIAVGVGAMLPVCAGLIGVIFGVQLLSFNGQSGPGAAVSLDSHVRYLSGLLLGIGLTFWTLIPRIETAPATKVFRMLTVIVFIGGLGRLLGVMTAGVPSLPMLIGLGMELVVTPLLCLWQGALARRAVT